MENIETTSSHRKRNIILLAIIILAILIIAAVGYIYIIKPTSIKAQVTIKPSSVTLTSPPPYFNVSLRLPKQYSINDVNTTTVTLESLSPTNSSISNSTLYLKFNGDALMDVILIKVSHVSPTPTSVALEISGKMLNGKSFEGTVSIAIT